MSSVTKIAFLLGSGVSIPAGMPSTQDLTEIVLSGKGIGRHSNNTYLFGQSSQGLEKYVSRIVKFLGRLKIEIDSYYQIHADKIVNYEDFYYLVNQICDSEYREYDNPAVQPFIEKILQDVRQILNGWELRELAQETENYIQDVIWRTLFKLPTATDYLNSLTESCNDKTVSKVDIFTLNYDTVLEQHLNLEKTTIIDGFDDDSNIRRWKPELYESGLSKVRFFKLHGSINWFRLRTTGKDWFDEFIGIPQNAKFWEWKDKQGRPLSDLDGRPQILAGRFNKMYEYARDIFAELQCYFIHALQESRFLVVCGYGFGDRAINTRIINWVYSRPGKEKNRIVIIHPNPEKLKTVSGAIEDKWDVWRRLGILALIPRPIEQTSWAQVKEILFNNPSS